MTKRGRISTAFFLAVRSCELLKSSKKLILVSLLAELAVFICMGGGLFLILSLWINFSAIIKGYSVIILIALVVSIIITSYFLSLFIFIFLSATIIKYSNEKMLGGKPLLKESIKRCLNKAGSILCWSTLVAVVGIFFSRIRKEKRIFRDISVSLGKASWHYVSLFVLQAIILEGMNVKEALKESANIFKNRWGESFAGEIGIGSCLSIIVLPLILCLILLIPMIPYGQLALRLTLISLIGGLLATIVAVGISANLIYRTALYRYAITGQVVGLFPEELLKGGDIGVVRQGWPRLFSVIVLTVGLLVTSVGSWTYYSSKQCMNWPTVTGKILDTGIEKKRDYKTRKGRKRKRIIFYPEVKYEYYVNGVRYTNDDISMLRVGTSNESKAYKIVNKYLKNNEVIVYYNPTEPEEALLNISIPVLYRILIFIGVVLLITGLAIFFKSW